MPAVVSQRPLVVALDGPSGSGKSSVSQEVARLLELEYIDTGATYRAVCWSCLDQGIALTDQAAVADHARRMRLRLGTNPDEPLVMVGGRDVTRAIRESRISSVVSLVATNLEVRAELRAWQRELIEQAKRGVCGGCVVEGRDITTVVAPDADVRILLTASEQTRLARRALEVHGTADLRALDATRDQVVRRDADDSAVSSFMSAADGVVALDSSSMSFDETVQAVIDVVIAQVDPLSLDLARAGAVSDACAPS